MGYLPPGGPSRGALPGGTCGGLLSEGPPGGHLRWAFGEGLRPSNVMVDRLVVDRILGSCLVGGKKLGAEILGGQKISLRTQARTNLGINRRSAPIKCLASLM